MPVDTDYGSYPENFAKYVRATPMVDTDSTAIRKLANTLKQDANTPLKAITAAHDFVSRLPEGFDKEDKKASYYLAKGRGQCNTKSTLFIAIVRAMGIPARVHVWRIYKQAHKEHMPALVHAFTAKTTIFTYPEVYYKDKWLLLSEVLRQKGETNWSACPFNDAPKRTKPLKDEWIAQDLGSMWHPDDVYKKLGTNTKGWRRLAFPFAQLLLHRKKK